MARPSLRTVRGGMGLFGRTIFGRGGAGRRTNREAGRDTESRGAGGRLIEGLEGRVLMAVQLVSAPADAAPTNAAGNALGDNPEISEDGRWVVFASDATNLVAGVTDGNANSDVFLRDLQTGATAIISVTDSTARGGELPSISADGRYIAFNTTSAAFVQGGATDANGANDVYVYDRTANTYTLASAVNGALTAIGNALQASISGNGRVVSFTSAALSSAVVSGTTDTNATQRDVFVRNLDTNVTTLISATPGGTATGNGRSDEAEISSDGNFVVFRSQATDLTAIEDLNGGDDVFRRAVAGTAADLVSVGSGTGGPTSAGGESPSVSTDGNLVAFESGGTNLVVGDTNGVVDVFVRDMTAGAHALVSTSAAGALGNGNSRNPSISANGVFVAFQTNANNLVTPDTGNQDIVLKNRADGSIIRLSQNEAGEQAAGASSLPSVDADGNAVAFVSTATNLATSIEPQPETDEDVFAWTTGAGPGTDTQAPTAAIVAPNVTTAGGATQTITVTYTDNVAVDVTSIDAADLTVTQAATGTPLTVTGVTANPASNAAVVTATYTVAAPGGTWDAAESGAYNVALNAGQVRDTSNNTNAAGAGAFNVTITGGPVGPGPDLTGAIATTPPLPPSVIGGQKGRVRLQLTNSGDAPIQSPVGIQLVASADTTLDAGDAPVTNVTRPVRLRPGRSRFLVVPFAYPTVADGQYFILANLDSANGIAEGNEGNNVAASAAPVLIAAPFVDLVASVGAPPRGSFTIGRRTSVPITITNNGNVPAGPGLLQIDLFGSADAARGVDDLPLATITRPIRIRNARSRIIRVNFIFPAELAAGSYYVTTTIDAPNAIAESNETNNDAASSVAFTAA